MKPKKLIRNLIVLKLKEGEWETINSKKELNKLYDLKIREELEEIKQSDRKDIMEFADIVQAALSYAKTNGFDFDQVMGAVTAKAMKSGKFGCIALNNLNPNNPSNKLYFEK